MIKIKKLWLKFLISLITIGNMSILNITKDNFQKEVLEDKGIVFVDFYAEWCGPCKMVGPIIEELSENKEYKDKVKRSPSLRSGHRPKQGLGAQNPEPSRRYVGTGSWVKFVKVNVDSSQELASQYNIFSIPTFIIFKQGKPAHQFTGAMGKEGFIKEIKKVTSQ